MEDLKRKLDEENAALNKAVEYFNKVQSELDRMKREVSLRMGRVQMLSELLKKEKEEKENEQSSNEVPK